MTQKKTLLFILFFLTTAITGWGLTARQIINKNRRLPKPRSSKGTIKLVIKNRGLQSSKVFQIFTKKFGSTTKSRINFLRPNRMQFLIYSLSGGTTRQWIKLSSGRIRRIASGSRSASWANSHFYYEDLRTYSPDDYRFVKLSDAIVKSYKKKDISCYRLKAVHRSNRGVYSKRIIYIDKNTFQIRRVQFYQRGRHSKTLTNYLFKKINGINTPRLVYMEPTGKRGSFSYLLIQNMRFNIGLPSRIFNRSAF